MNYVKINDYEVKYLQMVDISKCCLEPYTYQTRFKVSLKGSLFSTP
jgi:hypothetical protein